MDFLAEDVAMCFSSYGQIEMYSVCSIRISIIAVPSGQMNFAL